MKNTIVETISFSSGYDNFARSVMDYFKLVGMFSTGSFKAIMFELGSLFRTKEEQKIALERFMEDMKDIRGSMDGLNRALNKNSGFETALMLAVAPQLAFASAGLNIGAHLYSPLREDDREDQVEFMEQYLYPYVIGLDTTDPKYIAARNSYIKSGASSGLRSVVADEESGEIYRANRRVSRYTDYTQGPSARFSSDRFDNIFFGSLNESKESKQKEKEQKSEDLISPIFDFIKQKHGNKALSATEKYLNSAEEMKKDIDEARAELSKSKDLDELVKVVKQSENRYLKEWNVDEYISKLEQTRNEHMQSEKFDPEEYAAQKPAAEQKKLRDDKEYFKKSILNDIFNMNWKMTTGEINKDLEGAMEVIKNNLLEQFDPEIWEAYDGKEPGAIKIKNMLKSLQSDESE